MVRIIYEMRQEMLLGHAVNSTVSSRMLLSSFLYFAPCLSKCRMKICEARECVPNCYLRHVVEHTCIDFMTSRGEKVAAPK